MFRPKKTQPVVQEQVKQDPDVINFEDTDVVSEKDILSDLENEKRALEEKLKQLQAKKEESKVVKPVVNVNKQNVSDKVIVVKELPLEPVRKVVLEDGSIANLITIEEALTELLEAYRNQD